MLLSFFYVSVVNKEADADDEECETELVKILVEPFLMLDDAAFVDQERGMGKIVAEKEKGYSCESD